MLFRSLDNGFISKEKYARLIRTSPLTEDDLGQFIARQLVETNQTAKAVIDFLKACMDDPRRVIYSKAKLVSNFRQIFSIIKCRDINNLHHAQDAYLNIVVGNIINTKFTDDPRNFYKQKEKQISSCNENIERKEEGSNIKNIFTGTVFSHLTHKPV